MVRPRAGEIRHHAHLAVGIHLGCDPGRLAHPGMHAIGRDHQPRMQDSAAGQGEFGRVLAQLQCGAAFRADEFQVVLVLQPLPQHRLQTAALDDSGEFGDTRFVGGEAQLRIRGVAMNVHFVHGSNAVAIQPFPHADALQERSAAGTDGVDAAVPIIGNRCRRLRLDQRQLEPAAAQCQGEARTDQAGADDDDIEVHPGILNAIAANKRKTRQRWQPVRDCDAPRQMRRPGARAPIFSS